MTKEILTILTGTGFSALIAAIVFYFWIKKKIQDEAVEPIIAPFKMQISNFEYRIEKIEKLSEEQKNDFDRKLNDIYNALNANTAALRELMGYIKGIQKKDLTEKL